MTGYVLDTSAYSAFRLGRPDVVQRIRRAERLLVPTIVLGELHYGFAGGRQEEQNESELAEFLASPRVEVLEICHETARRYAWIRLTLKTQGGPLPTNDLWIAAAVMKSGLPLLTLDRHFLKIPQVIVDLVKL